MGFDKNFNFKVKKLGSPLWVKSYNAFKSDCFALKTRKRGNLIAVTVRTGQPPHRRTYQRSVTISLLP